ncbi:MAG: hypothetical protein PF505_13430 [Vallitaleaceae bacterium]|jgi:hypothetical protein|nr:hypothetical protein [Vallitaleaceae bacterium]
MKRRSRYISNKITSTKGTANTGWAMTTALTPDFYTYEVHVGELFHMISSFLSEKYVMPDDASIVVKWSEDGRRCHFMIGDTICQLDELYDLLYEKAYDYEFDINLVTKEISLLGH